MTVPAPPLAERIRPRDLSGFIGQSHLVGVGKPLLARPATAYRAQHDLLGPARRRQNHPGAHGGGRSPRSPSTTCQPSRRAKLNCARSSSQFSSCQHGNKRSQLGLFAAPEAAESPDSVILFLDEIHRFNKAQQDFLLPYVEDGTITLIGATTENPSFEVISALLSRMQVFTLNPLTIDEIRADHRSRGRRA